MAEGAIIAPARHTRSKFLLVGKYYSKNSTFGLEVSPILGNIGARLKFSAPKISVGNLQMSVGELQLDASQRL